ncbi:hypothetical protein F511_24267 [Dorcoceras hygrometricum]|uniref:Uncharacterized protein n=1 Tax=Dorcoceras hygrometricum TaxID=472368 RepID=A0A2Z7AV45_9LAMI|nr:hypothetical protein F511_24267 [Dorcoceras hygrometricum]
MTPSSKQAKGFAAQICVLLKGAPDLTLGEAKTLPPLKILTIKTVGTYVAKNKSITTEEVMDEPPVEKVVKKATTKGDQLLVLSLLRRGSAQLDIVAVGSVVDTDAVPIGICDEFQHGLNAQAFVDFFVKLVVFVQFSSSASRMHFTDDIPQTSQIAMPTVALSTDFIDSIAQLRASIDHNRLESLVYCILQLRILYIVVVSYQDARSSGNTALTFPCWDLLATMRRVVNYHNSWARLRQVELFDASGNLGFTAGRGFNPAGGAPGGG